MADRKPYYITTAIAYASGKPHIGNTYEIILADAIARYKRLEGFDVHFQTGTDEHGQKIQDRAEAAGMTPKEYVDRTAGEIRRIWDLMNTSYDHFIRTTDEYHEKQIQKTIWANTRGCTARSASPSTPNPSWWTANARWTAVTSNPLPNRPISSG